MPIANDMKNIAEGIEVSYGERVAFLSDLSKGTNETLKTFHREHQKMAGDLGDFLSSDRDNREKVVASLRGKNKRDLKAMAEKLAHNLRESTSSMKKDTAELMIHIREDINSMEKEIASLLSKFDKERHSMGKEMKEELASTTRGRVEQVKKMLGTFSAEHEAKSRELRHQLSSFQKELETTVKEMRVPVIRDLKESRQNWQNLARIMAAKRDTSRYPSGYRRAGKAVTPAKKIEGVLEEEKEEVAEAVSNVNLKVQVMRLISAATSGISLVQMGRALRIPYIRLAKPASELVKQGEIKKEDSKYLKA